MSHKNRPQKAIFVPTPCTMGFTNSSIRWVGRILPNKRTCFPCECTYTMHTLKRLCVLHDWTFFPMQPHATLLQTATDTNAPHLAHKRADPLETHDAQSDGSSLDESAVPHKARAWHTQSAWRSLALTCERFSWLWPSPNTTHEHWLHTFDT
jgi:hypothetical protein